MSFVLHDHVYTRTLPVRSALGVGGRGESEHCSLGPGCSEASPPLTSCEAGRRIASICSTYASAANSIERENAETEFQFWFCGRAGGAAGWLRLLPAAVYRVSTPVTVLSRD